MLQVACLASRLACAVGEPPLECLLEKWGTREPGFWPLAVRASSKDPPRLAGPAAAGEEGEGCVVEPVCHR